MSLKYFEFVCQHEIQHVVLSL